ncbi:MAG: alpha/beta hydrolase, partial [Pseudomonadota bacterium]|nr:alpha/beta hydrolase [Pseudomonadota bacterium]
MTPAALDALLASIGPRWQLDIRAHSQQVKEAYEPLLAAAPRGDITITRDLAYGPHPRQVLDVFKPARVEALAPVVAFVHGGAFVRGDKRATTQIYDNVALWFARQGCIGLNVEYRLAPEVVYPAGGEDVTRAVHWLREHAAEFGGDPWRLFLIGHSAGGTHAAAAAFDPAVTAGRRLPIAALVLISARLRADRLDENPNADGVAAYFGADASLDDSRSPLAHVATSDVPVMVAVAQYENPLLDVYGLEFAQRLGAVRR